MTSGKGDMDVMDTEIEKSTERWQEGYETNQIYEYQNLTFENPICTSENFRVHEIPKSPETKNRQWVGSQCF